MKHFSSIVIIVFLIVLFYTYFTQIISLVSENPKSKAIHGTKVFSENNSYIKKPNNSIQSFPTDSIQETVRNDVYRVKVVTGNPTGEVIIAVNRTWAPLGAARFEELVKDNYFNEARFFRVIHNFMAQVGIHKDPSQSKKWRQRPIQDDPVVVSNQRSTISFATSGKNTRTAQIFFNFVDNKYLDKQGFTPFGKVEEGMEIVDKLYFKYGEGGVGDGSDGHGPNQNRINQEGNDYLMKYFPNLSYIQRMELL